MLLAELHFFFVLVLLLYLLVIIVEGLGHSNATSPWLNKVATNWPRPPRPGGCRRQPWICRQQGNPPTRWRCCKDRCVNISSDVNNCGLCRIRCPFSWQCCRGFCVNTNISPFNCGRCGNRCPFGVLCLYGLCGYAQPTLPPWPCPPWPPFPFPPKRPWPPRPQPPPIME
ncbi:hypothetical protein GBA52_014426 [Prunus armeniaca]|nr:hypothetical protein GBA52_014426 [Prunus armeniaca]